MGTKTYIHFSRYEVIDSTGCTSNQLAGYEKTGLIVPIKLKVLGQIRVLYTKAQLLQVKAIQDLRSSLSLQRVRKIIEFLDEQGFDKNLYNKQIVVLNDEVFWVSLDWGDFSSAAAKALKIGGRRKPKIAQYMLTVIPPLKEAADDLIKRASKSNRIDIADFKRRLKDKAA
jgi:DNA-binding transcriptional MerR regulator